MFFIGSKIREGYITSGAIDFKAVEAIGEKMQALAGKVSIISVKPVLLCNFNNHDNNKKKKWSTLEAKYKSKRRRSATTIKGPHHDPKFREIMKEIRTGKLDIDPEVAMKGKVDFVQVESWGKEDAPENELENLKMRSFSPSYTSLDSKAPFYEQLVRRLQLLEAKGDISVVQGKPLPPFEKWLFSESNYLQFLLAQEAVHVALENVISSLQQSGYSIQDDISAAEATAVSLFDKGLGLFRSEALKADIQSLSKAVGGISNTEGKSPPKVSTQAVAYAKYIERLGRICTSGEKQKQACLRLLAHIFVIHVVHLTTGMRIGSKALDSVSTIAERRVVSFYHDYPQQLKNPLEVLQKTINKVGELINSDNDCEEIMLELPKAIQKTSLLMTMLAVC